jgi:hypothetical protein
MGPSVNNELRLIGTDTPTISFLRGEQWGTESMQELFLGNLAWLSFAHIGNGQDEVISKITLTSQGEARLEVEKKQSPLSPSWSRIARCEMGRECICFKSMPWYMLPLLLFLSIQAECNAAERLRLRHA